MNLRGLFSVIDRREAVGARIEAVSRRLLGRPSLVQPLVGSAETPEVFTFSLDGFDCVTYVETVLALASCPSPARFAEWLRRIRYQGGRVAWPRRHHYMSDWIRYNVREGFLRRVTLSASSVARVRTLDVVPGLRPRRVVVRCLPKRAFAGVRAAVHGGDVLCFASTRRNLDFFHTGFAFWSGGELRLRHASRSQGRVVEQDLAGFLKDNAMAGVVVVRPVDARRRRPAGG